MTHFNILFVFILCSPRGSNRFSLGSNSDADSPRVLGLPSLEEREENNDVKKTPMLSPTHNDSTVGILDLDSIQCELILYNAGASGQQSLNTDAYMTQAESQIYDNKRWQLFEK